MSITFGNPTDWQVEAGENLTHPLNTSNTFFLLLGIMQENRISQFYETTAFYISKWKKGYFFYYWSY